MIVHADCLDVLQKMDSTTVDLIYIDPPFFTGKDWGVFDDQWDSLDSYLKFMQKRVVQCRRLLSSQGSLYLHCDPKASHYLKIMLDEVFGRENFRNEIIWSYRRWPSKSKRFQTMHDVILYYSRGASPTFNVLYEPPSDSYLKRFKGKSQRLDPQKKTRKIVIDESTKGMPMRDVWQVSIIAGSSKERVGYATQKPLKLLERIIKSSSNEGDLVLDPFCGSGTTLVASERLGRRWIGIDSSCEAIRVANNRMIELGGV